MSLQSITIKNAPPSKEAGYFLEGTSLNKRKHVEHDTFISAFKGQYVANLAKDVGLDSTIASRKRKYTNFTKTNFDIFFLDREEKNLNLVACREAAFDLSFTGHIRKAVKSTIKKLSYFSKSKLVNAIFRRVHHYFNIITLTMRPFESRLNRVKLLQHSHDLILEKEAFKAQLIDYLKLISASDKNNLSTTELSGVSNLQKIRCDAEVLNLMAAKIKNDKKQISSEYKQYLLGLAKNIVSNLAWIVSNSPFKILIDFAFIIGKIPGLVELLDFIIVLINSKQVNLNRKVFNVWKQKFTQKKDEFPQLVKLSNLQTVDTSGLLNFSNLDKKNLTWNHIRNFFKKNPQIEQQIIKNLDSESFLEKAKALKTRKIVKLVQSENFAFVEKYFDQLTKTFSKEEKLVFEKRSKFSLLNEYIDKQIAIEKSVDRSLGSLIGNKLKLENIFMRFKSIQANFSICYSALALSAALIGALIGMAFGPIGAVTYAVTGLFIASMVMTLSFLIVNHMIGSKYRSHTAGLFSKRFWKLVFLQIKHDINSYWLKVKEAQLNAINPGFKNLIKAHVKDISLISRKKIQEFLALDRKTQQLSLKLENLKKAEKANELIDFSKFSKLPENYLETLKNEMLNLNFDLLEEETKNTLQYHLGLDLNLIHKFRENADYLVRQSAGKTLFEDLRKYFNMNDDQFVEFMKFQNIKNAQQT